MLIAGWREWVTLPSLSVPRIKAKLDSGARSSAIHAFDIQTYQEDGIDMVRFSIHPRQNSEKPQIDTVMPIHDRRNVRSSNGVSEQRIVVRANLGIAGTEFPIDLTLTNRDAMGFRLLLGREAMRGRILIDPERSYMCGSLRPIVKLKIHTGDDQSPAG